MLTFAEHFSPRTYHLTWNEGDLEHHLAEDYDIRVPSYPHLLGVKYEGNINSFGDNDHLDSFDMDHHNGHVSRMTGSIGRKITTADQYKEDSNSFNNHLRRADREHGKLRLRTGYGSLERYHHMDEITSNPLNRSHVLWRGVDLGAGIHRLKPGTEFTDHGYTGTSTSREIAMSFAGNHNRDPYAPQGHSWLRTADPRVPEHLDGSKIIARIGVPEGTRAHYMKTLTELHSGEREMTLQRGTRFRVTHHSLHSGADGFPAHVVHMNVVGQHSRPIAIPKHLEDDETDRDRVMGMMSK